MQYYLIIGYQLLEKYKEFPTVRIHSNGQLVDEFKCDNEQTTEISVREIVKADQSGFCYKVCRDVDRNVKYLIPKKHRIVELDSSMWSDNGELVIEVLNNNSNYNNGFISKRSIVSFGTIFLIRKDLLNDKAIMHRIMKKAYRLEWRRLRNYDDRITNIHQTPWPGFNPYHYQSPGDDGKMSYIDSLYKKDETPFVRGGNFKIEMKIRKKHKIHLLCKPNLPTYSSNKGYFRLDQFFIAWYQHYTKKYFDCVLEESFDRNSGKKIFNFELKEKSKE